MAYHNYKEVRCMGVTYRYQVKFFCPIADGLCAYSSGDDSMACMFGGADESEDGETLEIWCNIADCFGTDWDGKHHMRVRDCGRWVDDE